MSELFGIDGVALMTQSFVELLPQVADPHRFQVAEARIQKAKRGLKAV